MMIVLIVEDDDDKADDLSAFISKHYATCQTKIARSLKSGLRESLSGDAALILLDMTMRNHDRSIEDEGGRPHHFAGREILRQMQREGVRIPTIVVTNFGRFGEESEEVTLADLKLELEQQFPDYLGTVHYRSNVDEWKSQLKSLISDHLGRYS